MGQVSSANEIVHEDLSNVLILSDMRNTVVFSRMKNGERPKSDLFGWPIERMGKRRSGGIPENKDVDAFEGDKQKKLYNRVERWWRTPRVTVKAEKLNDVAGVGTNKMFTKQKGKKVKDQKRDIEFELLSDQDSYEDDGVTGDKMMGLGRVINDGTLAWGDQQTAIPRGYRTPTNQIFSTALATLDEAAFTALCQARWTRVGATGDFTLFAAPALKTYISQTIGVYKPNVAGYSVVVHTTTQSIDRRKIMTAAVDVIESEYGTFDIELASFMPTTLRGYGLDMEQLERRALMLCDFTELAYKGGGRSGLVDSILSYQFGDPRAHFKIAPSDEVAFDPDSVDAEED